MTGPTPQMKRRMKDMIDVSDRYAVLDLFDNLSLLATASAELEREQGEGRRSAVSLGELPSFAPAPHNKTFRSLSDHLCVLRKTYLH